MTDRLVKSATHEVKSKLRALEMNWSWRIATVSGISIRVHWTMVTFLIWIGVANLADGGFNTALSSVGLVAMVFTFIVLHELGHAITAQYFGIQTRDITLLPIGGVARLNRIPEVPHQEILVALAGPAVNVIILAVLGLATVILSQLKTSLPKSDSIFFILHFGLLVNLAMAIFNLLPAFPMDGGRVLRALLVDRCGYVRATNIAASIGQSLAIALGILGLFFNGMLIFIAMFVYLGAQQEAFTVQAHNILSGIPVRDAMRRHLLILSQGDQVESALNEFMAGNQHDFPVADQYGQICGMVYRNDLLKSLSEGHSMETIDHIMHRDFVAVAEETSLEHIFVSMNESECKVLPVLRGNTIIGLISLENIGEWLMIHSPRAAHAPVNRRLPSEKMLPVG